MVPGLLLQTRMLKMTLVMVSLASQTRFNRGGVVIEMGVDVRGRKARKESLVQRNTTVGVHLVSQARLSFSCFNRGGVVIEMGVDVRGQKARKESLVQRNTTVGVHRTDFGTL